MASMVEVQKRIELEKTVVRGLIRFMKKKGFRINQVYSGEDEEDTTPKVMTEKQIMDEVFNLDTCRLYFKEKDAGSVLLVRGNDGWDIISDWSYKKDGDPFTTALEEYTATLDKYEE